MTWSLARGNLLVSGTLAPRERQPRREAGAQSYGPPSGGGRAAEKRKGSTVSEEMQEKVDAAVWKYLCGEELTDHEQTLLAYTWFAAGCPSCGGRH